MSTSHHAAKAMYLAVRAAAGREVIFLGDVPGGGPEFHRAATCHNWGYWLLDTTLTGAGLKVVIEANGSNGATSSIGDGDKRRVAHVIGSLEARGGPMPGHVAILGYQDGFHHVPEFHARALAFVDGVERTGTRCSLLGVGERPTADVFNVVVGDLPSLARILEANGASLLYMEREVALVANPNLLPALARSGVRTDTLDLSVFHEGHLVGIGHDKGLQQDLCAGTSFTPLWHAEAHTAEAAVSHVSRLHSSGVPAVVKPNATSGGVGVRVIAVGDDVVGAVAALVAETSARYGSGALTTAMPLRVFEFAQALPLPHGNGVHLWDLRIELTTRPGAITARPIMVRMCPRPFTGELVHDAVVSNLTGRQPSTRFILDPAELDRRLRMGVVSELCAAALEWAQSAEVCASRGLAV